jgi:GT2 family glycosyltransferase
VAAARAASARRRRTARAELDAFLASGSRIAFAPAPAPVVSIVIAAWNGAELTLACLESLHRQTGVPLQVIVVDNASTDETPALLDRVDGLTCRRQPENAGFTRGSNIGARLAAAEYLLFVNNDIELEAGAIAALVEHARRGGPSVGAVGGQLVFQSGALQEAGSIVWRDGSCAAYGRGGDSRSPDFQFARPVDFCSAALLLTPRAVFEELGGFDERYSPAYYEDADYCARVWQRGLEVRYEPRAVARQHEFGSAGSGRRAIALQSARQPIFRAAHARWLAAQAPPGSHPRSARSHPHGRPAAILIDDRAPDRRLGAGFPRAAALVAALRDAGFEVTVFGTAGASSPAARHELPDVEFVDGSPAGVHAFLDDRLRGAPPGSVLIVSRPHNLQYVKAAGLEPSTLAVPLVYDAEAIFADREISRRAAAGEPLTRAESDRLIAEELRLARGAAAILTVNERDRRAFEAAGFLNVTVAGHSVVTAPPAGTATGRDVVLFVGAFGPGSMNEDAARFLCREVRPALADTAASEARLVIAGTALPAALRDSFPDVEWRPDCDDLTALYRRARAFAVPAWTAAGIPLKILEAAAHGVPAVATPLLAAQLGWAGGQELLVANDARGFAAAIGRLFESDALWVSVRDSALARVSRDHAPAVFRAAILSAIETARRADREDRRARPQTVRRAAETAG